MTHTLTLCSKKIPKKEMEELHNQLNQVSLYSLCRRAPTLRKFFSELFELVWIAQGEVVRDLPPPNSIMRGYESTPGVWLFEDTCGYCWSVWSDGKYKNCFKGTSIYLLVPGETEITDFLVIESFVRLYKQLNFEPKESFA